MNHSHKSSIMAVEAQRDVGPTAWTAMDGAIPPKTTVLAGTTHGAVKKVFATPLATQIDPEIYDERLSYSVICLKAFYVSFYSHN